MMNDNEYRYLKQAIRWGVFQGNMITALIWGSVALVITVIAAAARGAW